SKSGQILSGSVCCGVEAAVHSCPCCFLPAKVQRRLVASTAASSRKQTCPLPLYLSADLYTASGGVWFSGTAPLSAKAIVGQRRELWSNPTSRFYCTVASTHRGKISNLKHVEISSAPHGCCLSAYTTNAT
ncbi:unnamed protein product, partial [Ectocarpus sp. 13 AM-2016]